MGWLRVATLPPSQTTHAFTFTRSGSQSVTHTLAVALSLTLSLIQSCPYLPTHRLSHSVNTQSLRSHPVAHALAHLLAGSPAHLLARSLARQALPTPPTYHRPTHLQSRDRDGTVATAPVPVVLQLGFDPLLQLRQPVEGRHHLGESVGLRLLFLLLCRPTSTRTVAGSQTTADHFPEVLVDADEHGVPIGVATAGE